MIAICPHCQTKHQLKVDRSKGPAAKYRCLKCGTMNKVEIDLKTGATSGNGGFRTPESAAAEIGGSSPEGMQSDIPVVRPKISGFSIKTKLTFTIVALILISLTSVSLIASLKGEDALTLQASNHLMQSTNQKAREYNNIFSRLQDEIEGMALFANSTFRLPNDPQDLGFKVLMPWNGENYGILQMTEPLRNEIVTLQHIGVALQGLVKKNPYLELGYMATPNNVMVLDDEKIVDVIGAENGYVPSKRPWYLQAMKTGETIWTQPYIDVNTKKLVVTCATPVFDDKKKALGVLGFDVLLDTIQKDIISLDIGYASQAFLLGRDGAFLAKPGMTSHNAWNQTVETDNALETENADLKRIITEMIAGRSGVGVHVEKGNTIIVSYAPLQAIDASLGIVISQSEVMKPATDVRKLIFAVWGAAVILSIFVGLAIGNGITKPINELSWQAELISQGKSDLNEITSKRKDEIGLLVESYNRLIASLRIAISRRRK